MHKDSLYFWRVKYNFKISQTNHTVALDIHFKNKFEFLKFIILKFLNFQFLRIFKDRENRIKIVYLHYKH